MQVVKVLGALVVAHALVACGGLVPSDLFSPGDAGAAGPDAPNMLRDAHSSSGDGALEASGEPTFDGATPPPFGNDATTTMVSDAGDTGAAPPPASVPCGGSSCTGSAPVCCVSFSGQGGQQQGSSTCVAQASDCTGNGSVPVECGSTADCPSGDTCCVDFDGMNHSVQRVSCASSCGASGLSVCQPNGPSDQCPNGDMCLMSQFPGYGVCYAGH